MTLVRKIRSHGTASNFAEAISRLVSPGDYVEVVRGVPRSLIMACPDGCGENITINLDKRAGPAWRKYVRHNRLTVYPSVWRESGCESHFIIWQDQILWCGRRDDPEVDRMDESLGISILHHFPVDTFVHYLTIAEETGNIPWEVYWSCLELAKAGSLAQGKMGTFKRIKQ